MIKLVIKIILSSVLILLFEKCAQVGPLSGGKRDIIPPQLVEAIPINKSVNFNANQIILRFNERLKLTDLKSQLIISPKLAVEPEIEVVSKTLLISFKTQALLPNTTYRFYFGKSITDMTEGNSTTNFEYVFSTGSVLDSLKINGTIKNAFNNKIEPDAIIGLYPKAEDIDSLPFKKTPNYITRSNEKGEFAFSNLSLGDYKIVGFLDKNKNYLYDGEVEKLAYTNNYLSLLKDTTLGLMLFKEDPVKTFVKKINSPYYGLSQLILNKKAIVSLTTLDQSNSKNIFETKKGIEKDTVAFYYHNLKDTLMLLLKNNATQTTDSLQLQIPKVTNSSKKFTSYKLNTVNGKLKINDTLRFLFANWMDTSRTTISKIKLSSKEDSAIKNEKINCVWQNNNTLKIGNKLKQGVNYTLAVDTFAFADVLGNKNDSSRINFITENQNELGKLSLKIFFDKKQNYIVQLINQQEQVVREKFVAISLSSSNAISIDFTGVVPDTYQIKIVFDSNENKKWDTGNFHLKTQPESVFIYNKSIKVLADWEIEEEIFIKD